MKKEVDVDSLVQIVGSIEQAEVLLEQSYETGDVEKFEQSKKFILSLQRELEGALE